MIEWPTLSIGTLVSISPRSRTVWGLATRVFDTTTGVRRRAAPLPRPRVRAGIVAGALA
jgi:hypothetical protein